MLSWSLYVIYNLLVGLGVLVSVGFVTLMERKILSSIQYRKGPDKLGIMGIFQPISDGIKLLSKGGVKLVGISELEYNFMGPGMLLLMLIFFGVFPLSTGLNYYVNSILIILCLMGTSIFPIMFGSWFSGCIYSKLGCIRAIAQMISYEVSFLMIVMTLIYLGGGFSLSELVVGVGYWWFYPVSILLFISVLIELNRTPNDLIEGESEIVSGFSTEFYGFKFAWVVMGEYGMIIALSGFMGILYFGVDPYSLLWIMSTLIFVVIIISIRGMLPRVRVDYLMEFCWTSVLGSGLGMFVFISGGLVGFLYCN